MKSVFEVKAVNDDSGAVGKRAGLGDVHAPSVKNSGQRREQASTIGSNDSEFVLPADAAHSELHRLFAELARHLEVQDYLVGRMRHQIALRQAVEELQQLRAAFGQQRGNPLHLFGADFGVEALFVHAAVEIVGCLRTSATG